MAPTHRRGPWVQEEDNTLLQLVHEQGPNNWVRISQQMHFRSPKQCRERFHQNLKPSLNHTPISAEEGLMIERMVNEMGKRWAEIARRLGNRSDNAVKNWWNGNMNRKRRGLVVQGTSQQHSSRACNGRIEAPYPRASDHRHQHNEIRRPSTSSITKATLSKSPVTVSQLILHERPVSPNHQDGISRHLVPILTSASNSNNRVIEPSMTSPAFSEVSTLEPPSMVSDHNSVSSASPRTLPSPQMLPVPNDSRLSWFAEQHRRGSVPTFSSYHLTSSSREEAYFSRNSEHESGYSRHWSVDHNYTKSLSETAPPSSSRRDSRMGLQSLLN
ncbi:MYB family conidiophore development protein FlbD, putative [Talaromyces stipitatus ATCC 10500]|uniref:MYB family conidiophore development protein FlbD, putative n=1 Tax=Talaromyces stipitatus (strain ATCC 10500 / CBS 375.48 / QM 6759 / NRRL 1006) TaxID=441959 RepID=B8MHF2_TALSN|nr:MYB family conidiophore development protein FlbD, putative [Talaromyces stipitatus ATCC 10500]EED17131.1 MYB family conidiophore development protein FlbD, putative [Talaromyces stipitatus ATCC 10500]